jgi:hypothetical protein
MNRQYTACIQLTAAISRPAVLSGPGLADSLNTRIETKDPQRDLIYNRIARRHLTAMRRIFGKEFNPCKKSFA